MRLLLAMNSRRRARGKRGGTDWWHGRSDACGLGTEAELLQSLGVELPRRIQTVRLLEFFHGVNSVGVPLAAGFAAERTVFGKGALNFGNTIGSRGFLPLRSASCFSCGFRAMRLGTGPRGRRFCGCSALPLRGGPGYTHASCNEQRQGQVGRFAHSHRFRLIRCGRRCRLPRVYCCWLSAGTTPDKNTVRMRSLSWRRNTLNTTFSPALSFLMAAR